MKKKKAIVAAFVSSCILVVAVPSIAESAPHEDCTFERGESVAEFLVERLWGEFAGYCIGV